jgi:hypothetical protein
MIGIYLVLAALFAMWVLFVFFVAVIALRDIRDRGELNSVMKFFGYPTLFVGYIVDAFVNCIFPGWILFADWPIRKGEYLFTDRLKRYYGQETKRGKVACWFCDKIVQVIDKRHCIK